MIQSRSGETPLPRIFILLFRAGEGALGGQCSADKATATVAGTGGVLLPPRFPLRSEVPEHSNPPSLQRHSEIDPGNRLCRDRFLRRNSRVAVETAAAGTSFASLNQNPVAFLGLSKTTTM